MNQKSSFLLAQFYQIWLITYCMADTAYFIEGEVHFDATTRILRYKAVPHLYARCCMSIIFNYPLPITNYQLPITHYPLPILIKY